MCAAPYDDRMINTIKFLLHLFEKCVHKVEKYVITIRISMPISSHTRKTKMIVFIKTLCIFHIFPLSFPLLLCLFFMFTRLLYLWLFFWAFDYTCSLSFFCLYDVVVIYFCQFLHSHFHGCHSTALKSERVHSLCVCSFFTNCCSLNAL